MTKDEALKMAIESVEQVNKSLKFLNVTEFNGVNPDRWKVSGDYKSMLVVKDRCIESIKACKEALQPEPTIRNNQTVQKPLSDEEITAMANIWSNGYQPVIIDFARAIEKSHGIG